MSVHDEAQRASVYAWVEKWRGKLLLPAWGIEIVFEEDPFDEDDVEGEDTYAKICVRPRYLEGTLSIYPHFWTLQGDAEFEKTIIHELIHCLIYPLELLIQRGQDGKLVSRDEMSDVGENATEMFAEIVWSLAG